MSGWNDADVDELHRLRDNLTAATRSLSAQVAFCRQMGMPWQTIADALGVTRQAAHKRFRSTRVAFEDQTIPLLGADDQAYIDKIDARNAAARAKFAAKHQQVKPSGGCGPAQ